MRCWKLIEVGFSVFTKCIRFILMCVMVGLLVAPISSAIQLFNSGETLLIVILSLLGNILGISISVVIPVAAVFFLIFQILCPYKYTLDNDVLVINKLFNSVTINIKDVNKVYPIYEGTLNKAYVIECNIKKYCLGAAYYDKNLKKFVNELTTKIKE